MFIAGGRAIVCRSTTKWKSAHPESARMNAKAAASTKNMAETTAVIVATTAITVTIIADSRFLFL